MIPEICLNIWEHSQIFTELSEKRAKGEAPEMDAAAQAAEILSAYITRPGLRLLDAGCGGGYFYHSLARRHLDVEYYGLDYSPGQVAIAKKSLATFGQNPENIHLGAMEDFIDIAADLVLVVNALSFCPDFRAPLDRLAATGAKVMLIRDNFGPKTEIRWETDGYLDEGFNHLKAYWNRWSKKEVTLFLSEMGFEVSFIKDKRTGGHVEKVVDKDYYWAWCLAVKLDRNF